MGLKISNLRGVIYGRFLNRFSNNNETSFFLTLEQRLQSSKWPFAVAVRILCQNANSIRRPAVSSAFARTATLATGSPAPKN